MKDKFHKAVLTVLELINTLLILVVLVVAFMNGLILAFIICTWLANIAV